MSFLDYAVVVDVSCADQPSYTISDIEFSDPDGSNWYELSTVAIDPALGIIYLQMNHGNLHRLVFL
jgi:hypothetical protein